MENELFDIIKSNSSFLFNLIVFSVMWPKIVGNIFPIKAYL